MREEYSTKDKVDENYWKKISKWMEKGIYQYSYLCVNSEYKAITPADPSAHVVIVTNGSCYYEGILVKRGDMFVCGMNKEPLVSYLTNISLFCIDLNYSLLYQLCGLIPSSYNKKAKLLKGEDPFLSLGQILLSQPINMWIDTSEDFIESLFEKHKIQSNHLRFDSVIKAADKIKDNGELKLEQISLELSVSPRQIQRQFASFFGMTPREYSAMIRFSRAFWRMNCEKLSGMATEVGYYDQSHMNREFKKMTGISPYKMLQNEIYPSLYEIRVELYREKDEKNFL